MITFYPYLPINYDLKTYNHSFIPQDNEALSDIIVKYIWSPCYWEGGKRLEANFRFSFVCALDFETPEMTLEQAKRLWCDCEHIIGVTKRHGTPEAKGVDRFRVIVPWERPITDLREYRYQMAYLRDKYDADGKCVDGARYFFPCKAIVQQETTGYHQEVMPVPDDFENPETLKRIAAARKAKAASLASAKMLPRFVMHALTTQWETGTYNSTCYRIGCDLGRMGYGEEEIVGLIIDSPTYGGSASVILAKEIQSAVRSGIKTALSE